MKLIIGQSINGDYQVRIEIGQYQVHVLNGKKLEDCSPFCGVQFEEEDKKIFISAMKQLISVLEC